MTALAAPRAWTCAKEVEFCRCGRQMVRTLERRSYADGDTGEFPIEAWHSCPGYFVPFWKVALTLGMASGMGHQSHSEANPILGREWR